MGTKRLCLALFALFALAGCGSNTSSRSLSVRQIPLVPGAKIVTQARVCDGGSNPYCALEVVAVDRNVSSSGALTASEDRLLHRLGWKSSAGDDGDEAAANSPGQKLRITFASAFADLLGIDEHWITRSTKVEMALDRTMFERTPAMSLMLELGAT
jgi:hypothetical protein